VTGGRERSALSALTVVLLITAGCGGSGIRLPVAGPDRTSPPPAPSPIASPTARPARHPSCPSSLPSAPFAPSTPIRGPSLAPPIAAVAGQVEAARGLRFLLPVTPRAVSRQEIARQLSAALAQEFTPAKTARRGRAWITIGAISQGTDLLDTELDLRASEIVGFYDSRTRMLEFIGSASPTPYERFVLSHELTHALDDQHFGLGRLDALVGLCADERKAAFLALAEGDAVETSLRWVGANLSPAEIQQLREQGASFPGPPATIPPFVQALFTFPYPSGQAFVQALLDRGGQAAVNRAFRSPPLSTEQILHPEKYPSDVPHVVEVPDLAAKLGTGWGDLDAEGVGEGWLRILLELRLGQAVSEAAAAGWDGGQYRAWSAGGRTAVDLVTVWDSAGDGAEFAAAMQTWAGSRPVAVTRTGSTVTVLFGSNPSVLKDLQAAAG
jgi:hypothetical protein